MGSEAAEVIGRELESEAAEVLGAKPLNRCMGGEFFGALVLCIKPTSSPPVLHFFVLNYEIDLE